MTPIFPRRGGRTSSRTLLFGLAPRRPGGSVARHLHTHLVFAPLPKPLTPSAPGNILWSA